MAGARVLDLVEPRERVVADERAEAFDEGLAVAEVAGLEHACSAVHRIDLVVGLEHLAAHPVVCVEPCEHGERPVRVVERPARMLRRRASVGDVLQHEDVAPFALSRDLQELADHPVDAAQREVVEQEEQGTGEPRCRIGVHLTVQVVRQRQPQGRVKRLVDDDLALVGLHPVTHGEVRVDLRRYLDDHRGRKRCGGGLVPVPGEVASVDFAHEADVGADVLTANGHDGPTQTERVREPLRRQLLGALRDVRSLRLRTPLRQCGLAHDARPKPTRRAHAEIEADAGPGLASRIQRSVSWCVGAAPIIGGRMGCAAPSGSIKMKCPPPRGSILQCCSCNQ